MSTFLLALALTEVLLVAHFVAGFNLPLLAVVFLNRLLDLLLVARLALGLDLLDHALHVGVKLAVCSRPVVPAAVVSPRSECPVLDFNEVKVNAHVLQGPHPIHLFFPDQSHGVARQAVPASPADPVDNEFQVLGNLIVDHQADARQVDPPGSQVAGDDILVLAGPDFPQGPLSFPFGNAAVDLGHLKPCLVR